VILETMLLTALFALAAVAFIGVLNARGPWRTTVAALLALLCLIAALWHTGTYRALGAARAAGLAVAPVDPFAASATSASGAPGSETPAAASVETGGVPDADRAELLSAVRALRDSMAAEDPSRARGLSDAEYQALENRASHHLARARMLRERAARLAAAAPPGFEEGAEFLTLSLQTLNAAARDLNAFFHATDREEEQRLLAAFRQGVEAADGPLRRAESKAGALSTDF
jgi:hypothetical protein